ncbi:MAG: AAA family ATPase, partial [Colwellia sp.]
MPKSSTLHGHKHILVIDNDNARSDQIATVLSFVGERFLQCQQDQADNFLKDSEHILTVILSGD